VYLSGLVGWVMVASFVLAMPDVGQAAAQGGDVFAWLMKQVAPGRAGAALWVAIVVANYLCGLACMTSTSRMMYAFARDGGLPWSRAVSRVSPRRQTPVVAIWTTAGLALGSTAYAPVYSTLTAACVVFLYLSYVMPTLVGMRAMGRTWTTMGPFDLGARAYRALGVVAIAGVVLLVWIGVQPPNEKALWVTGGTAALLLVAWWAGVRRSFRGPPVILEKDAGKVT
jgi:amino acid transporter